MHDIATVCWSEKANVLLTLSFGKSVCAIVCATECACVCVCVCVMERGRERELSILNAFAKFEKILIDTCASEFQISRLPEVSKLNDQVSRNAAQRCRQ